ncbi:MAG: hypothetical protein AAF696_16945 [Bacteroidota bacterium]
MRIIFLSSLFLFLGYSLIAQDEAAVRGVYSQYKTSIMKGQGASAARWVSQSSLDYYEKMMDLALHADSSEIEAMRAVDRVTILRIRLSLTADQIKGMDGKTFFIYGVDKGFVDRKGVQDVEIGEIKIMGDEATGGFVVKGKPAPLFFGFIKEKTGWKFDLNAINEISNQTLEMLISQGGYEKNDFILRALRTMAIEGEDVGMHLWHPLEAGK